VFLGRVVKRGEPLWTDEDRAWALALVMEEAEVCPGCGQPIAECTDPQNEFVYQATSWRCHACTAKDAEAGKYRDAKPGIYLSVRRG
jgi:hypothetical protein